ncbi:hypothetical protein HD554DRAFT_869363 [Boletus coccyginus]|nr:hypothetical protein HD554DRAFT_869363 [Boletus coccyginus]
MLILFSLSFDLFTHVHHHVRIDDILVRLSPILQRLARTRRKRYGLGDAPNSFEPSYRALALLLQVALHPEDNWTRFYLQVQDDRPPMTLMSPIDDHSGVFLPHWPWRLLSVLTATSGNRTTKMIPVSPMIRMTDQTGVVHTMNLIKVGFPSITTWTIQELTTNVILLMLTMAKLNLKGPGELLILTWMNLLALLPYRNMYASSHSFVHYEMPP